MKRLNFHDSNIVMGILNATDDSFSGDGIGNNIDKAKFITADFIDAGVDIIDIGGESTRPKSIYSGVQDVTAEEELSNVIPIIEAIKSNFDINISIDTRKSEVAREALKYGANIINDISMLKYDENMINFLQETNNPYILTHNKKINSENVSYQVRKDLEKSIDNLVKNGIKKERLIIDPGFGFNKTVEQNIELHNNFDQIKINNVPILVGTSKKSFLGEISNNPEIDSRTEISIASALNLKDKGANIFRMHDAVLFKKLIKFLEILK
tara:strand:+ start:590 stop:1393 length:804 start_codon:yes stop_codon:yes gene_type:complete